MFSLKTITGGSSHTMTYRTLGSDIHYPTLTITVSWDPFSFSRETSHDVSYINVSLTITVSWDPFSFSKENFP
ncbi:hypothetical protein RHMOL_Rhmol11G0065000 [Rhododendron molle]|uniref:Uncharacterized protein n=1 Tax=Rhododendron molle TaxID=49168 RepID=A0ACC0LQY7_RHOML|nr:hypothetical protein RHMOL_Rhmol11G0065000 [Rhododendron molle]